MVAPRFLAAVSGQLLVGKGKPDTIKDAFCPTGTLQSLGVIEGLSCVIGLLGR